LRRRRAAGPEEEALVTQPPPDSRELGFYVALAQVGLEMVAPIGIGLALDYYFGWLPWATVICTVVGFVSGMVHLVVMVQKHDAEQRRPPGGAT
jgi:F0F1-type ATP synthase assembly protein I